MRGYVPAVAYWGLRDYGTAQWEGGEDGCDHLGPPVRTQAGFNARYFGKEFASDKQGDEREPMGQICGKCGAKRIDSQIGLEKTPEEYVAKMVEVFRAVRRVLRKDGTCWVNMGDGYASQGGPLKEGGGINDILGGKKETQDYNRSRTVPKGLKPKDLVGMPWRLAFALQADGWWLRSDVIWAKPNPMPESCTDRPTKSHEYLFLLTKSANYYFDAEAIKERGTIPEGTSAAKGSKERFEINGVNARPPEYKVYDGQRNKRSVWTVDDHQALAQWLAENEPELWHRFRKESCNKKDVWTIAATPYLGAHFATYPPDLIKPCIMAGTSAKGCCAKCGSPWDRMTEKFATGRIQTKGSSWDTSAGSHGNIHKLGRGNDAPPQPVMESKTVGWTPSCLCTSILCSRPIQPCTVLDPFAGSGTTGQVALELGRKAILIELNPEYVELIRQRCNVTPGLALA